MNEFLGTIKMVAFHYAPKGWMLCDGAELPIMQYQALFALLRTAYGGDGVNTFRLPDLRGFIPGGAGQATGGANYVLGEGQALAAAPAGAGVQPQVLPVTFILCYEGVWPERP